MAGSSNRTRKSGGVKGKPSNRKKSNTAKRTKDDVKLMQEIEAVLVIAVCLLLFCCNFGIIGAFGKVLSSVMFGLFGILAYVAPLLLGFIVVFMIANGRDSKAIGKTVAGSFLFLFVCMFCDMIGGIAKEISKYDISEIYKYSSENRKGGGVIAATVDYLLVKSIDKTGTYIIIVVLSLICFIILTRKSLVALLSALLDNMREKRDEDRAFKAELNEERLRGREERQRLREESKQQKAEADRILKEQIKQQKADEKILRQDKKAVGITKDTKIEPEVHPINSKNDNVHEIILNGFDPTLEDIAEEIKPDNIQNLSFNLPETEEIIYESDDEEDNSDTVIIYEEDEPAEPVRPVVNYTKPVAATKPSENIVPETVKSGEYQFPPLSLLKKPSATSMKDSAQEIRDTANKLQETLAIFGVKATVTDISQGPTVTRFELQPELGVKVSRIKNLSDDIKLNLAASDIRIEAPIPGKAAIGIEVPNKVNQAVLFRELIDNPDFEKFNSNLAFAVGKDIGGKNIIFDIDKFPHLLIAGATGSGKSVCINTIIMSILYKAHPDDVKLIMIDPKVVELSVYNGIPHLLLPVVTDAKKAAATLNYAVTEMMERYKKFADMNTRDLAGYNREVEARGETEIYKKLPQIVIIVDELADLIMVAKNDVEDAICRLAQLARAAGIHLVIATQRPSVDVITGLIKANMPSRIAFAVSSNTDSRTILDMGGAEELLGHGDMLFFPKGLKKPVRLQGGFVDDPEVNAVVDFLKQNGAPAYDADIEQKIMSQSSSGNSGSGDDNGSDYDDMFIEAGRFIIEANKASIGMLQRKFKMGFNRAARVMDQLAEAGVVGPDEGTKPRQILMGPDQFENFIENNM